MIALETALSPIITDRRPWDRDSDLVKSSSQFGPVLLLASASLTTVRASRVAGSVLPASAYAPATEPGRIVGRYQLIERLGQGSQGEVWRAFAIGSDGDDIALKLLPPALARDPRRSAQFRHEAERGTRIGGPALLPTCDYGEADGLLFMAMPLVDGCSLSEVIAWRRKPDAHRRPSRLHHLAFLDDEDYLPAVVKILAGIARALASVHARGVVHLDIKPANILLAHRSNDEGYLCDFGLGRDLDIATPAQIRDGAGTPLYMAPERLLRRFADERLCDVFALGATLYEAVALAPPLQVPEGLPWHAWHTHLAEAQPEAPSALRNGIAPQLNAIILRSLARLPEQRYPTAEALAEDLERFLAGAPVEANGNAISTGSLG